MLGAIIGDIVGSRYEFNNIKTEDFPLFDDKGVGRGIFLSVSGISDGAGVATSASET